MIDGIEKNKKYVNFDDGKINYSRRSEVVVVDIIPFAKISEDIKSLWESEVKECDWLYSTNTDYFIKAELNTGAETIDVYYVRALRGGWFSMGFWAGRLDYTGELDLMLSKNK